MLKTNAVAILDKASGMDPDSIRIALSKCNYDLEVLIVAQAATDAQKNSVTSAKIIIVVLTRKITNNPAINVLIELAAQRNIRIVGVWIGENSDHPKALDEFGDAALPIDDDAICEALNGTFNDWKEPTGSIRGKRKIIKANC